MLCTVLRRTIFIRNEVILMSHFQRSSSSVVDKKLAGFNNAATTWWDPKESSMKQLHVLHPYHVAFVRDQLGPKGGICPDPQSPLTGYKIADVGCGVGMNSEMRVFPSDRDSFLKDFYSGPGVPIETIDLEAKELKDCSKITYNYIYQYVSNTGLALLGAEVTGLDPGDRLIHQAKVHAAANPNLEGKLKYLASTVEEHRLTHSGQYDAVMAFYVLEHIQNRQEFIDNCLALLNPNGSLFLGHCNRSLMWFSNMLWQKYVTGLISKSLLMPYSTFLTNREMITMVNNGHLCELNKQKNMYFTLNGRSARETHWMGFLTYSHFVRKDNK